MMLKALANHPNCVFFIILYIFLLCPTHDGIALHKVIVNIEVKLLKKHQESMPGPAQGDSQYRGKETLGKHVWPCTR